MNKKSILVVDDSDFDRSILTGFLTDKGYRVVELSSGEGFLEVLEKEKPVAVILDILMPKKDGNQLLKQIRETYSPVQLPVLMITVKDTTHDIVESLCLGANDYIMKPFDPEIVHMRIFNQVKISELSEKMSKMKEMEVLNAMTVTYNHEINNPLAIAISNLKIARDQYPKDISLQKVEDSLWRISSTVKKISQAAQNVTVEYNDYTKDTKMVKVK